MPIGIRPTNDYAFKRTFGVEENKNVLIRLLNAILKMKVPITQVTLNNTINNTDTKDGKLSILDIKATDQLGNIHSIEVQVVPVRAMKKRLVYYTCEAYIRQLQRGDDYRLLLPVYTICIFEGTYWENSTEPHHGFRLIDKKTGRILDETIEIHTVELGCYNLKESDLGQASELERWGFWLKNAQNYDVDKLAELFPENEFQQANHTLENIASKEDDRAMYDAQERARRDQAALQHEADETLAMAAELRTAGEKAQLAAAAETAAAKAIIADAQAAISNAQAAQAALMRERAGIEIRGEIRGEIRMIVTLQQILGVPVSSEVDLQQKTLESLQEMTLLLRSKILAR